VEGEEEEEGEGSRVKESGGGSDTSQICVDEASLLALFSTRSTCLQFVEGERSLSNCHRRKIVSCIFSWLIYWQIELRK